MPIYEYRCTNCGKHVEIMQKMSDAPARLCNHCNTEGLERQLSRTSFVLKGTGWYATDYKSSSTPSSSGGSDGGGSSD